MADTTKRCSTCKKTKPVEEFNTSPSSRDGRRYQCAECDEEKLAAKQHAKAGSGRMCQRCCNLPWQRPKKGVCRCGLKHEPERMPTAVDRLRGESSAAQWLTVGDSELTNFHRDEKGEFRNRGVSAPPEYRQPMLRMRRRQNEFSDT